MNRSCRLLLLSALAFACASATANASLKVSAWTSGERLAVARDGSAQITWREGGRTRTAVVRGDHITYRATIGRRHIGRHVAPDVAYGRAEVVLRNGTHYALQRIRRLGQFGRLGAPELRFARWRGEQPRLSLTSLPRLSSERFFIEISLKKQKSIYETSPIIPRYYIRA